MASRTLLALTTPVAAHAIAQTAYHRREPMHAPGAIDESGRCPDHHAAARLGNAKTASATSLGDGTLHQLDADGPAGSPSCRHRSPPSAPR